MKIRDIISETAGATTSGSIATVSTPLGSPVRRVNDSFFSGKYMNSADPYPNTPAYMKVKKRKKRVS